MTAPFPQQAARWDRALGDAEKYVRGRSPIPEESSRLRTLLRATLDEATAAKSILERDLKTANDLLAALGAAPKKGDPPEPREIASKRQQYAKDIATLTANLALAELTIKRGREAEQAISALARTALMGRVLEPMPMPLAPDVIADAVPEFFRLAQGVLKAPIDWYEALSEDRRQRSTFWRGIFFILIAVVAAAVVRRFALRRFGRNATIEAPTYARRLVGAIVEAVARGIVPAAVIIGVFLWLSGEIALVGGRFQIVVRGLLEALLIFVAATAVARAVLAPELPAWRVVDLNPDNGRTISRRITILAVVFAIDHFLQSTVRDLYVSAELSSFYLTVATTIEGLAIVSLTQGRLWETAVKPAAPDQAVSPEPPRDAFWTIIRRLVAAVAILSIVAMLVGYVALGRFVIERMLFSGAVVGGLILLRGLLNDFAGLAAQSSFVQHKLGVGADTLRRVRFWAGAALDPLLVVVGLFAIAPFWGVPREDLIDWTVSVFTGFKIGNVTFSPGNIAIAFVVFFVAMAVTRLVQRRLSERVLPQTRIEPGLQHSLTAGVGYIGVVLAAALAIAVAGVDLTNVALVAGALSVGIGFGLQNIVNNFVSGLILLIERPIKVGDWVVIGNREGTVKRIRFRATEIETWQRASVIIPNAEILSSAVTNWTLNDKMGRLEIPVGVAYGSDTQKVKDVLLECARKHPMILAYPPPAVLFQDFGDSSLNFELRCFTSDITERVRYKSDLLFEIERRFREERIDIPFPQRVVHLAPAKEAATEGSPTETKPRR